jgi:tetratricopeptide (TPR) repeat protein
MCVLGLAGGARGVGWPFPGIVAAIVLLFVSVWVLVTGAIPATRQQARMVDAAAVLWPLAERHTADVDPAEEITRRVQAAEKLLEAQEALRTAVEPRLAAAEQLERASWRARGPQRIELLQQALSSLQPLSDERDSGRAIVLAYLIHRKLAELTGDEGHEVEAIALARRMTELDPNGLSAWTRLGDVLWEAGRLEDAAEAYRRVLAIDENFELDPLKQLTEKERAEIERRIAEAR